MTASDPSDSNTERRLALRRHWRTFGWLVALSIGVLLLQLMGDSTRQWLRYERSAILDHQQWWRLLTGHLVHGSWRHAWLNLAGLWLIAVLLRGCYSRAQWLCIAALAILAMDLGFIYLMPELDWYVGLSGLLHGLLAAGALAWWRIESRPMVLALSVILIGKLTWEHWQGALPLAGDLNVIVNAHLYGAIGGMCGGILARWWATRDVRNGS